MVDKYYFEQSLKRGGDDGSVGMPLGNLTSQFFANVYLNELDQFVKHELKIKYYIRYVDDFVILGRNKQILEYYKEEINNFLINKLKIQLHPDKSDIFKLNNGVNFLGFRVFYYHKLLREKNIKKFERRFNELKKFYKKGFVERENVVNVFEGWITYVSHANTYKHRRHLTRLFNKYFPIEIKKEVENIKKHENFIERLEESNYQFTSQKTLQLLKKGLTIKQIAEQRQIKESTVWEHIAKLIEYGQLNVWKLLPKDKILKISYKIHSQDDKLKDIKQRLNDNSISFDEINCVLASIKHENKKKNIIHHVRNYKRINCFRKCYFNPKQRETCSAKFDDLISKNPNLELTKKEFLDLFNNHMNICILPEKEKLGFISYKEFIERIRNYKNKLVKHPLQQPAQFQQSQKLQIYSKQI